MKKVLSIILLLIPVFSFAQKQANIWYFGIGNGLDFSSGSPVLIPGGQTGSGAVPIQEGTSSIADSDGNLLFYSDGRNCYNRVHQVMPNGAGIMGGYSSTQSALIVPVPKTDSLFYLFTSDHFENYTASVQHRGYRYSIIDMCLDSGKGDVLLNQKNILLSDSSTEKLAACLDTGGTGYWVVGHKMFSNQFIAWHLTASGITDTVETNMGRVHGWDPSSSSWISGSAQGQMKFDAAGTKLVLAIGNIAPAAIYLYDFDAGSGVVSNECRIVIDSALNKQTYGVEFSPDGSKIYAGAAGGNPDKRVYQFDLNAGGGNCDSIKASMYNLHTSTANSVMLGFQVAPEGKIYVVGNNYYYLCTIDFPNLSGAAAGFNDIAVSLPFWTYTTPGFIAGFKYLNQLMDCVFPTPNSVPTIPGKEVYYYPNPASDIVHLHGLSEGKFQIYEVTGRLLSSGTLDKGKIDISFLMNGIYYLRINETDVIKFIKQ